MYKIVIVDDEPLISEALAMSIDWEKLNCTVAGRFTNAQTAMDFVLDNHVDILLLDINMPQIDGLTIAQILQEKEYNVKVIIISAYKDFKHAQKALQVGVYDYITKPIRNAKVIEVVKNAIECIAKEREAEKIQEQLYKEREFLQDYFEKSKLLVQTNIINDILRGQESEHSFKNLIQIMPVSTFAYSTMVIKHMSKIEDEGVNKKYLLDYIKNYNNQSNIELKATVYKDNIVLIIFYKSKVTEYSAKLMAKNLGRNILEYIVEWEDVTVCIGVSTLYKDVNQLQMSYLAALNTAENQFFASKEDIGFVDNNADIRKYKISIIHQLDSLYSALHKMRPDQKEEIQSTISSFYEELSHYAGSIDEAKSIITEVCITVVRLFISNDKYNKQNVSISNIINDVNRISNMKQAQKYTISLLNNVGNEQENKYSIIVNEAIKYIYNNYNKQVSLEDVSKQINVNPSYLSRTIKKETDKNFSEMLTDSRIDAAKRLLLDPKLRLNEIAVMIGYKDYAYFYQVFKKVTGNTPMNYRKQNVN